jgi:glycosyltransferase involved in cell wall biosynthesis
VLISGKRVLDRAGGHETYVRAHALAAASLGLEPHIFCAGRRARTTRTGYGVVHEVPLPLPVALHGPPLAAAVARWAGNRSRTIGIHGFAIWSSAGVLASRALSRRGVTAIPLASAYATRAYEVEAMQAGLGRHLGPLQRLRYRAWRRWARGVDDRVERFGYAGSGAVLVNYASVERILRRSYGLGATVRRVPYASAAALGGGRPAGRPAASLDRPRPAGPPRVLAVSRHDPRKGLDVLLRALADVRAEGIPFRASLIGPGALLAAHRGLAVRLGLAGSVAIPGKVDDVRPYLADADVFVLPSLAEASGSVSVLEALDSGVAVIATACDGIPEDLAHDRDALLVSPGDHRALAAALSRLLADPALRARLAEAGRDLHERRFSAARFVDGMRTVYGELGIL